MRRLLFVVLAASACASATKVAPAGAPQRATSGETSVRRDEETDPCEERRRYGDGVCDEFCPEVDPDCVPRVAFLSPRP